MKRRPCISHSILFRNKVEIEADPSDTPALSLSPSAVFPVRSAQEFLGDEDALGEGALELGEDLNPVSAPAPRSLCAALLCSPLLTAAPVPEAAAATVPPALTTPLSRSLAVAAEATPIYAAVPK
jgi:hypothetical protein